MSKRDKLNIAFGFLALVTVLSLPLFAINGAPVKVKQFESELLKFIFWLVGFGIPVASYGLIKMETHRKRLRVALLLLAIVGILATGVVDLMVVKSINDSNKQAAEFQKQMQAFSGGFFGNPVEQERFKIEYKMNIGLGSILLPLACAGILITNKKQY